MLQVSESLTEVKFVAVSFWFWVKAGLGFAVGMALAGMAFWFLWLLFFINILTGLLRAGAHR